VLTFESEGEILMESYEEKKNLIKMKRMKKMK
jgi:hypothetical protein